VLTIAALVSWARDHATKLEADMTFRQGAPGYGWWWEATGPAAESQIRARAAAALYFLDRFAGGDSQWMLRGRAAFEENSHSMETGARELGDLLREWADQVEAGIIPIRQVDAQGAGAVASSDLMDQVQVLIGDRDIHPAAPIVIAGQRWKSLFGRRWRSWICRARRNLRLALIRDHSAAQASYQFRT
jgi:hypothetical protein